jgi:putative ABC transport system permease protein
VDFLEIIRVSFLALRTNKVRSFLTTLGIIIGVASVILLVSIGTGLQNYVTKQFESLGSNTIYVMPGKVKFEQGGAGGFTAVNKLQFSDIEKIAKLGKPIVAAAGHMEKTASVKYRGEKIDTQVNGADETYNQIFIVNTSAGKWFSRFQLATAKKVVVMGQKAVEDLKIHGNPLKQSVFIGDQKFSVTGVLEKKGGGMAGPSIDNQVFIPASTYRKYFDAQFPNTIMAKFEGETNSERVQKMIKDYYYNKRKLTDDDFTVFDQKELLNTINQFLGVITVALGGIAAISLLVGGIGIMNIMLVSVTERTREIGLRKAIGATPNNILIQFLIEALVLSLVGGGIGILLGWIGSIALSSFIETAVSLNSILMAFGVSSFVGIFFGVAPAIKASRLSPIEALRYE